MWRRSQAFNVATYTSSYGFHYNSILEYITQHSAGSHHKKIIISKNHTVHDFPDG
jgi:hypothetical protein